ncbi:hypothetical protein GGX14DRAFT_572229 [Mycena pura]|uniref:Uncharacterized protein n=1 Tax=Mycena pura TaxID=153505 RepID=A0AAD6V0Z0_9AGAR|nr:hypothetical protein GGX14DRAFT_572229 [Mycena pura]
MPHLFQKITECILDMSLAPPQWRTRHHLFSTITLYLTRFEHNLQDLNLYLAQLIDTDACTFTPFVQRFELYCKHLPRGWEEPFSAFIRVLTKYTSLVAIKIGRWRSSDFYSELRPHPLLDMLAYSAQSLLPVARPRLFNLRTALS